MSHEMMQERSSEFIFGWDSKPSTSNKRSSGLFSVLKWFAATNKEQTPDLIHSASSSSCTSSVESVYSTDTVASFAFVPPKAYKPFGTALTPEKFISSGPETETYRARIALRDRRRESDRNLTLRSKYNLYREPEGKIVHSLPLMARPGGPTVAYHRRTASESSKHLRAGAYCHVKGKRRAPQPPTASDQQSNTLRNRKKRMAPQPPGNVTPDIICNDSLKLDHGILKPAKESNRNAQTTQNITITTTTATITSTSVQQQQVAPRPWYKRTLTKKLDVEKRKSGLSFLTNISELDREAMEIVGKESLKQKYLKSNANAQAVQAPAFMRPRTESDSNWLSSSSKRRSARDLIAKFNAITGGRLSTVQTAIVKEELTQAAPASTITEQQTEDMQQLKLNKEICAQKTPVTAVVKPISRSQWNCPKCTLENDYWRIICRVCSTIKPYFDDFTAPNSPIDHKHIHNDEDKVGEENHSDLFDFGLRISQLQSKVLQSHSSKLESQENKQHDDKSAASSSQSSATDLNQFLQPQYPKINLNVKLTENNNDSNSDTKPQYPKLDLMKDLEASKLPKLDDSKSTIVETKVQTTINKTDDAKKIEKIILGDELSYTKPKQQIEIEKETKQTNINNKQIQQKKIEKMILGDEISVEKPDYVNVNKYEKIDLDQTSSETSKPKAQNQKIEKMILGDDITNKQQKTEQRNNGASLKINEQQKTKQQQQPTEEEKQNSAKREEREKLKKMLIEMKNSLPKRDVNKTAANSDEKKRVSLIQEQPETEVVEEADEKLNENENEKTAELIVATTETIYENILMRQTNEHEKPLKVSSSVQTNAVFRRNMTADEAKATSDFQLIGANDFVEKTRTQADAMAAATAAAHLQHTYANLNEMKAFVSKTDTLEINRLLRKLETSIAGGELGQAAVFARELAQLKVPLSVIRQKTDQAETLNHSNHRTFNVEMYVEDKKSHRGPFPLQVNELMSVLQLKQLVENKYKIPLNVQRWILGKQLATNDNATLASHQILTSGCPVFLYLVAPSTSTTTNTPPQTTQPSTSKVIHIEIQREPETPPADAIEIVEIDNVDEDDDDDDENYQLQLPLIATQPYVVTSPPPATPPIAVIEEEDEEIDDYAEDHINNDTVLDREDVWKCRACTLLNPIATKECEVCGLIREQAEQEPTQKTTYLELMHLDNEDLVRNADEFECMICLNMCAAREGVTLRECLHTFCRACLAHTVEYSDEAEVKCPYRDMVYACDIALQQREVKALVSPIVYERHLAKSMKQAETKLENTFHCETPDCTGWCIYEDNVNEFSCPVCRCTNCLTCQAIHAGRNCKQYQEQMRAHSDTDDDARKTRAFLDDMIAKGEALACPTCHVVLLKKWGCDWLRCSMCKTEICWVTRGPRWGPAGKGDTSAGCKCGVNGVKCHPKCNYCH